jgi:hypothetical protein
MEKLVKAVLPVVVSPAVLLLLRFLEVFRLKLIAPLDFVDYPVVFLAALAGAGIASIRPRTNASFKAKSRAIGVSLAAFLVLLLVYEIVSNQPPGQRWVWVLAWVVFCTVDYFGTYFAAAYCLSFTTRVLIERGWVGKKEEKGGHEHHHKAGHKPHEHPENKAD